MTNVCMEVAKRNFFPLESGILMWPLISGTSVRLLVSMARNNQLDKLRQFAESHHDEDYNWDSIASALEERWPATAESVDSPSSQESPSSSEHLVCPITLSSFRRPVVASDGHTYELSAIMHHMAFCGMFSPLTKQPLTFNVFPNYDLPKTTKKRRISRE